ncbi:MAG: cell division protein ZapD [Rhodothermales bacterium]|nr:cell division protein ZapD [Rhodothermales bacterium]
MKESTIGRDSGNLVNAQPKPDRASDRVIYEQPLSERIRSFLRLEYLFERARYQLNTGDQWSSRNTLESIIDVLSVLSRADLKKELINELERYAARLDALARNPNVDQSRLEEVLERIRSVLHRLRNTDSVIGHELRYNELLNAVKQRTSMPAGTCNFDLPSYHYWLKLPPDQRTKDLRAWLSSFDLLDESFSLCLNLVRDSATKTRELAIAGFFQKNLETSTPCQMIRVSLSREAEFFAEISAGRHRFTVRFMAFADPSSRPVQTDEDIEFDLLCCVI